MSRNKDKNYIKKVILIYIKVLLSALSLIAVTPSAALAFDPNQTLDNLIALGQKAVILAVLIVAGVFFGKKELAKCLACVAVAALIIAVANIQKITALGQSFWSILGL